MKNITMVASISGVILVLVLVQPVFAESHVIIPKEVSRECESSESCFVPSIAAIKQGQSVVWKNDSVTIHSLIGGSKDSGLRSFQSGTLFPDDTFSYTIKNSGIFSYYCEIHPWMKGVIWST